MERFTEGYRKAFAHFRRTIETGTVFGDLKTYGEQPDGGIGITDCEGILHTLAFDSSFVLDREEMRNVVARDDAVIAPRFRKFLRAEADECSVRVMGTSSAGDMDFLNSVTIVLEPDVGEFENEDLEFMSTDRISFGATDEEYERSLIRAAMPLVPGLSEDAAATFRRGGGTEKVKLTIDGCSPEVADDVKRIAIAFVLPGNVAPEGAEAYPEWLLSMEEGPGLPPKRSDFVFDGTYEDAIDEWYREWAGFARDWRGGILGRIENAGFIAEDAPVGLTALRRREAPEFGVRNKVVPAIDLVTLLPDILDARGQDTPVTGKVTAGDAEWVFEADRNGVRIVHDGEEAIHRRAASLPGPTA